MALPSCSTVKSMSMLAPVLFVPLLVYEITSTNPTFQMSAITKLLISLSVFSGEGAAVSAFEEISRN